MLIPSSAPLSVRHPVTPSLHPLPLPLVHFPELEISHVLSSIWICVTHFLSFPINPFHYFLCSLYEWNRIMIILLRLTYFTQQNTFQFHPCWSKWWVFLVSNGWVIFHCIYRPQLLYSFIFRWTPRLLPLFGYCGHCCYKHWGAGVSVFHYICIFGVNPQSCNCWVLE